VRQDIWASGVLGGVPLGEGGGGRPGWGRGWNQGGGLPLTDRSALLHIITCDIASLSPSRLVDTSRCGSPQTSNGGSG